MHIEEKVNNLIDDMIRNDIDFTIDGVSNFLNIIVTYNEYLSCYTEHKSYPVIHIKKSSTDEMWKDFTHELGHFIMHDTDQRFMDDTFNNKQENEADKFSLLFRMPQCIIESNELYTEIELMEHFFETQENARKRLELLYNYYMQISNRVLNA